VSVLAVGLAAAPALAQTPPPVPVTGSVVVNGNWDGKPQPRRGGLPAQWLGLQVKPAKKLCFELRCARYALKLVKNPVRDGTRAARFEVRDGDNPFGDAERAEVQGARTGKAGSMRWYTWSTYLPPNFRYQQADDDHWLTLTQWAVDKGSAPIALSVDRGQLVLQVNEQASPRRFTAVHRPWGTPIAPLLGRWVDFALFVKWGTSDGQIQLWVDGVQQVMNWPFPDPAAPSLGGVGATAFTGRTLVPGGGPTFVRQGIVRAKSYRGKTVVVHDALKTYAATGAPGAPVAAPAPPPGPDAPPS
jgi:hypothetical protein